MKLYIDNKRSSNSISIFFGLLEEELHKIGGVTMASSKKADVILCGPTSSVASQWLGRKKIVQRLDGIYFNSDELSRTITKNRNIQALYEKVSGVIFQSAYSKRMIETILGKCRSKNVVVHNGSSIKPKYINNAPSAFPSVVQMKTDGYTICLASADWRPIKRLDSLIAGFVEYRRKHPKTVLLVAGPSSQSNNDGVVCLGNLSHRNMLALYTLVDLLINLSFSDACPNVVVEALIANKPILASSNQGSSEFYKNNGYIIQEPFSWKFEMISYANMPKLPKELVVDGIERALSTGFKNEIKVDMNNCARQYLDFLQSIR